MNIRYLTALLGCCLMVAGNATATTNEPDLPGGFNSGSVRDSDVKAAATFAVQDEDKRLQKDDPASKLSLVKIISVKQQVVAGTNYRLTMKVKLSGKEKQAEAEVYWQVLGKQYELTSWTWK